MTTAAIGSLTSGLGTSSTGVVDLSTSSTTTGDAQSEESMSESTLLKAAFLGGIAFVFV